MAEDLTHVDAAKRMAGIVEGRFRDTPGWPPEELSALSALFNATQTIPARERGACKYIVAGKTFCVDGVTKAECEQQLRGDFSQGEKCRGVP